MRYGVRGGEGHAVVEADVNFEERIATPGVCLGLRPAAGTKY